LGIGGHVSASNILLHFNPMNAEKFAEKSYATDLMDFIFGDSVDASNAENIAAVIKQNDFKSKPHFSQVVVLFDSTFGAHTLITFRS